VCNLERVVKGLGNLWEMFAKRKFSDDMGKVHDYESTLERGKSGGQMTHTAVVDMNVAAVAMAEGSNVKVC